MNKNEYIRMMYDLLSVMCVDKGYHNVACGMIAQSIHEGWNSLLATKHHNYWGMKASKDYKGATVVMDNKQKNDLATYRSYSSISKGCEGYFNFLEYSRYKPLKKCLSDISYLDMIGPCGWNSNIGYGDRCKKHLNDVYNALQYNNSLYWSVGQVYTLQSNMYIRKTPNGEKMKFSEVTESAKKNGYADIDGFAILKKGTRVTCKDVVYGEQIWLKIPSGYVCCKTKDKIYIL